MYVFSVDTLPFQAAPHHHHPPAPLSGCGRLLRGCPADAGSSSPKPRLLVPGRPNVWRALLLRFHRHQCVRGKHGAHIGRPVHSHLRPPCSTPPK